MMIYLECWCDEMSNLQETQLWVSLEVFIEKFMQNGKLDPECWQHHFIDWGFGLSKWEKQAEREPWFMPKSWLKIQPNQLLYAPPPQPLSSPPSCPPHHDGHRTLKLWTETKPSPLKLVFVRNSAAPIREVIRYKSLKDKCIHRLLTELRLSLHLTNELLEFDLQLCCSTLNTFCKKGAVPV